MVKRILDNSIYKNKNKNKELREQLGNNGREFFEKYLSVGKAYQTIMKHF
jgi:hypothetical protein